MMNSIQSNQRLLQVSEFCHARKVLRDGTFVALDEVDSNISGALVYCQNLHYLQRALNNPHISAIVCPPDLADELFGSSSDVAVVITDDPRRFFFELYIQLKQTGLMLPEMSYDKGSSCQVHPSAIISSRVRIGDRVRIGANSIIEDYTQIGSDVEIGPNVVIGAEGLVTVRQADGSFLYVSHAGGVEICDGCQLLTGSVVAKSLFRRFTHIGRYTQIGILANIGHGAYIGEACVISGNSVISGRVRLGDRVWVGVSASVAQGLFVGEDAQIKMGAVVVGDVLAGAKVSGNFAVSHRINATRYIRDAF